MKSTSAAPGPAVKGKPYRWGMYGLLALLIVASV